MKQDDRTIGIDKLVNLQDELNDFCRWINNLSHSMKSIATGSAQWRINQDLRQMMQDLDRYLKEHEEK